MGHARTEERRTPPPPYTPSKLYRRLRSEKLTGGPSLGPDFHSSSIEYHTAQSETTPSCGKSEDGRKDKTDKSKRPDPQ